mgnify:CR=1 FL=1
MGRIVEVCNFNLKTQGVYIIMYKKKVHRQGREERF